MGVSGPGVVSRALDAAEGKDFEFLCETIKRTAFKITRVGRRVTGDRDHVEAHRAHARHGLKLLDRQAEHDVGRVGDVARFGPEQQDVGRLVLDVRVQLGRMSRERDAT